MKTMQKKKIFPFTPQLHFAQPKFISQPKMK